MNGNNQQTLTTGDWELTFGDAGQTGGTGVTRTAENEEERTDDEPARLDIEGITGGWGMMQAAAWKAASLDPIRERYPF